MNPNTHEVYIGTHPPIAIGRVPMEFVNDGRYARDAIERERQHVDPRANANRLSNLDPLYATPVRVDQAVAIGVAAVPHGTLREPFGGVLSGSADKPTKIVSDPFKSLQGQEGDAVAPIGVGHVRQIFSADPVFNVRPVRRSTTPPAVRLADRVPSPPYQTRTTRVLQRPVVLTEQRAPGWKLEPPLVFSRAEEVVSEERRDPNHLTARYNAAAKKLLEMQEVGRAKAEAMGNKGGIVNKLGAFALRRVGNLQSLGAWVARQSAAANAKQMEQSFVLRRNK